MLSGLNSGGHNSDLHDVGFVGLTLLLFPIPAALVTLTIL